MTVIVLLSPVNKKVGNGNLAYRSKVEDYIAAGVSVVEIDLLAPSRAQLDVVSANIPEGRRAPYYTCVHRALDPVKWFVTSMPLREPLPRIPVPCRPGEPDVWLDLQTLLDRVYLEGGHDDIDYTEPPGVRLSDAAWAAGKVANTDFG